MQIGNEIENGICALKFSAEWCGPCKRMAPMVEKLASEFSHSAKFITIDVDDSPEIAQQFKIRSLPTFLVLKDGKEIERVQGMSLIEPLRKLLREAIDMKDKEIT